MREKNSGQCWRILKGRGDEKWEEERQDGKYLLIHIVCIFKVFILVSLEKIFLDL